MTLEDFFTLTEMKDGLTSPSRVQELVSVMRKEQDGVAKNAADATRQWASVASTIAATESKGCLDLFIQLDGLWFINRWLNDAQNFVSDANDGFFEESITAMLRAVEKLHLDKKKPISTGIWVTVSKLLGHHSIRIQDRARLLFNSWGKSGNGYSETTDMDIDSVNNSSVETVREEEGQPSNMNEGGNNDGRASGIFGGESQLGSSDSFLTENVANEQRQSSDNATQSSVRKDCDNIKETSNHLSNGLTHVQGAPIIEGMALSAEICNSPVPKPGSFKGEADYLHFNELSKEEKQEQNDNITLDSLGAPDISPSSTKSESGFVSTGVDETKTLVTMKKPVSEYVENNDDGVCHKITVSCDMRTPAFDRKDDAEAINSSGPRPSKASESNDDCSNGLQDSSVGGRSLLKSKALEMRFLQIEHVSEAKEGNDQISNQGNDASDNSDSFKMGKGSGSPDKSSKFELDHGIVDRQVAPEMEHVSYQSNDASNGSDSFKRRRRPRSPNIINNSSDIGLEYGIVDALEVARQVAKEVERELHSSSSDRTSEDGIRQSGSPDSTGKKDELTHTLPEEVSSRQSNSGGACSEEEEHLSYSENIEAEPTAIPDLECSQVTDAARDPGGNSEKSLCTFDLNEEVGSDDMDVSVNAMSATPIPVVSASKPVQISWLPTAQLQFERALGWKGSAATSAFRPASPRKNSDGEKIVSVDVNSDISGQRQDFLDIDLNVAEVDEELQKQVGVSSGLPSQQSSVELSPKQSRRIELDLNSIGGDGNTQPYDHRLEGQSFSQRNGCWSPSPASSSSSMQPSVRNIDLNNQPSFQTDLVEQGPSKSSSITDSYKSSKSGAPVISILGAKVEVGKREYVPQTMHLPNGKAIEPVIDLTMSGASGILGVAPSVPYNNSSVFGYNGLTSASPLSFSSATYGSSGTVPYMVDSRAAPAAPQLGSSYSQPPFIMSMAGTQLGLNGFGPSRPNFDINTGFMVDGSHRDTLAARQFFFPSPARAMEEHVRTLPLPSNSVVGGKRKEPESGWEAYPFNYKNHQPPWK